MLSEQCDYPLHLGVTEAGPTFQGTVKSAVAFGALLSEGIGDTIRVSLSAPPVEEVKVGIAILESLGLRERGLEIVSCPSCGRAQVDVYTLAEQVTAGLEGLNVPLRVAVMGCVVNGPGEAREADLGVASGNGKGQIFVRGEVIKTVPEAEIVETLIEEALRLADEMGVDPESGAGAPRSSSADMTTHAERPQIRSGRRPPCACSGAADLPAAVAAPGGRPGHQRLRRLADRGRPRPLVAARRRAVGLRAGAQLVGALLLRRQPRPGRRGPALPSRRSPSGLADVAAAARRSSGRATRC